METRPVDRKLDGKRGFNIGKYSIIILTVVVFAIFSLSSDTFFSYMNIMDMMFNTSLAFFALIGFTFLMMMADIDLSVGSMVAFSGMLVGILMNENNMSFGVALLVSMIISTLIGVATGVIVVKCRVNSMMITIGTMTLLRGVCNNFLQQLTGVDYADSFRAVAKVRWTVFGLLENQFSIQIWIIIMIVVIVILELGLSRSSLFKNMFYIGENSETARIYGIKSDKIRITVFAISAFTAAISGIILNSRIIAAYPTTGEGLEFTVLTACVLGGASLFGGKGSILRGAIGLFFLFMLTNGMVVWNIDPLLQPMIVGVILIIAVYFDTRVSSRERT